MIEVYEIYDRPVLFACRNASDTIFLAVLVSEGEYEDRWFYVPLSRTRFQHVRSGSIDLYNAFRHAEDGFVYDVRTPRDPHQPDSVTPLPTEEIGDDLLPEPDEYLRYETATLPTLDDDLTRKAQQANREYIDLSFSFPMSSRTEAPALLLGRLLENVQETIHAIGEAQAGKPNRAGPIPSDVIARTRLAVTAFSHGSFHVQLAGSGFVNLFQESDVGAAIEEFVQLVNAGSNTEELKSRLIRLQHRVSTHYLAFLDIVNEGNVDTSMVWASPSPERGGRASISQIAAKTAKDYMLAYEVTLIRPFQVVGQLIGANLRTRRYEIDTEDTKYAGEILESALPVASTATLSEQYIASIQEVTNSKPFTGEETRVYQLAYLRSYIPDEPVDLLDTQ